MDGTRCYGCGEDKLVKHEAVYTPSDGGTPLYLVVCADCGRGMASNDFTRLALDTFPSGAGRVEVTGSASPPVQELPR
jgi:hypothetical protein